MRSVLLAALRLSSLSLCLLAGLCVSFFFGRIKPANQRALIRLWSRSLLWCVGVRLRVTGAAPARPGLIVANHISWIDVLAIAAVEPAVFVSKSEIAAWPGIGLILRRVRTVFIRRAAFRDILRVNDELRLRLAAGETIAVFPEGTTTDGSQVLPFRPALFQPAVERGLPVYPAAVSYSSGAATYVGDTSFGESLLAVALTRDLVAEVRFLAPISTFTLCRKRAAAGARRQIAGGGLEGLAFINPYGLISRPWTWTTRWWRWRTKPAAASSPA